MVRSLAPDKVIPVEEKHIVQGIPRDQHNCAIVCAVEDAIPQATRVRANKKYISFTLGEVRYTYPTPREGIEAVIEPFDRGTAPEPITLRLRGGYSRDMRAHRPVTATMREYRRNLRKGIEHPYGETANSREHERFPAGGAQ